MKKLKILPFIIFILLVLSCSNSKNGKQFIYIKDKALEVDILTTNIQRNSINYLNLLPENKGLLICYPRERYQSIAIDNASVTLLVAFINRAGVIMQIGTLIKQEDYGFICVSEKEVQYALITAGDWFNKNIVKVGDIIKFPTEFKTLQFEELHTLTTKGIKVYVEIAETDRKRGRGLMFRRGLSRDDGMLFMYKKEAFRSFWMKNTFIPLSIAYIKSDGTISSIHDAEALNVESIHSKEPVQYVLEMRQDWFKEYNIKLGDKIEIPPDILAIGLDEED